MFLFVISIQSNPVYFTIPSMLVFLLDGQPTCSALPPLQMELISQHSAGPRMGKNSLLMVVLKGEFHCPLMVWLVCTAPMCLSMTAVCMFAVEETLWAPFERSLMSELLVTSSSLSYLYCLRFLPYSSPPYQEDALIMWSRVQEQKEMKPPFVPIGVHMISSQHKEQHHWT